MLPFSRFVSFAYNQYHFLIFFNRTYFIWFKCIYKISIAKINGKPIFLYNVLICDIHYHISFVPLFHLLCLLLDKMLFIVIPFFSISYSVVYVILAVILDLKIVPLFTKVNIKLVILYLEQ